MRESLGDGRGHLGASPEDRGGVSLGVLSGDLVSSTPKPRHRSIERRTLQNPHEKKRRLGHTPSTRSHATNVEGPGWIFMGDVRPNP